jgi:hypothetical protein
MCENNAHFVFFIKRRVSFFKLCTFRFAVITLILIAYQQAVRIFLFVYPSPHYLRGHHSWSPDGQAVALYI